MKKSIQELIAASSLGTDSATEGATVDPEIVAETLRRADALADPVESESDPMMLADTPERQRCPDCGRPMPRTEERISGECHRRLARFYGNDIDSCRLETIARLRQFAARLLSHGNQLATIAFNVSQPGFQLDDRARETMKESVRLWDEARRP